MEWELVVVLVNGGWWVLDGGIGFIVIAVVVGAVWDGREEGSKNWC